MELQARGVKPFCESAPEVIRSHASRAEEGLRCARLEVDVATPLAADDPYLRQISFFPVRCVEDDCDDIGELTSRVALGHHTRLPNPEAPSGRCGVRPLCPVVLPGRVKEAVEVRRGTTEDRPFVVEMARLACSVEDRPLPQADSAEVVSMLPGGDAYAVVAQDGEGRRLGAAWWCFRDPPLVTDAEGRAIPEMAMAVVEGARGQGIGSTLIEALAQQAATRFDALSLNVHIRNPATHLYTRTGFRVAAAGRGWFGVAMVRPL